MTSKARIAAIDAIVNEFLAFTWQDKSPPENLRARHERIKAAVESCDGGFDAWSVCALFSLLEEKAGKEIANLAALAQTKEPERLLNFEVSVAPVSSVKDGKLVVELQPAEQRALPEPLIAEAVNLKKHNEKEGHKKVSGRGGDATANVQPSINVKPKAKDDWAKWNKQAKTQDQFFDFLCEKYGKVVTRNTVKKKWIPKWNKEDKSQEK